jgi:hypothetical protein
MTILAKFAGMSDFLMAIAISVIGIALAAVLKLWLMYRRERREGLWD